MNVFNDVRYDSSSNRGRGGVRRKRIMGKQGPPIASRYKNKKSFKSRLQIFDVTWSGVT